MPTMDLQKILLYAKFVVYITRDCCYNTQVGYAVVSRVHSGSIRSLLLVFENRIEMSMKAGRPGAICGNTRKSVVGQFGRL